MLYVAFTVFAIMNIITGVFVESALACSKKDEEVFLMRNVREIFLHGENPRSSGRNQASGKLTLEDFEARLPMMLEYFRAIDVDPSEAAGVFKLLDLDNSNEIEAEELVSGCLRLSGPAKALDLALLKHEVRQLQRLTKGCQRALMRLLQLVGSGEASRDALRQAAAVSDLSGEAEHSYSASHNAAIAEAAVSASHLSKANRGRAATLK